MKNKIKLLLTALFLTLVWGFSFSSYAFDLSSWVFLSSISTNEFSFNNYDIYDLYCLKSSLSSNIVVLNNADIWLYSKTVFSSSLVYNLYKSSSNLTLNNYVVCIPYPWNDLDYIIKTNYKTCLDCEISWLWVYWYNFVSDCSSIQSSLNQCQSDLTSCTNSCDTLVSQCQADKQSCQSNYSGCLAENQSLSNYNDSLSIQLNECLSNWGSWDLWLTGCNSFSLFWNEDWDPFSLPIMNNLFLPNWFKSYITWGVQAIWSITNKVYDFTSYEDLNSNYWKILLFFFGLPFFALFIYYIKTYFFKLFTKKD